MTPVRAAERGGEGRRLTLLLAAALIGALVTTGLAILTSFYLPSADDTYGAPISVGRSCGIAFVFADPRCFDFPPGHTRETFSWLLFAVDLLVNWLLWFALARWSGLLGAAAGIIGPFVSILWIPVGLSYQWRIVGLPIPLGITPIPNAYGIWLDMLFWAGAAAALVRVIRRRWSRRAR